MNSNKSNRFLLSGTIILCALLPVVILSVYTASSRYREEIARTEDQLKSIALSRSAILDDFLSQKTRDAVYLANDATIREIAEDWSEKAPVSEALKTRALDKTKSIQESRWGSGHHIFIADAAGKIRLSPTHGDSKSSHEDHDISKNPYYKQATESPVITDFSSFEENDHFHQLAMAPIHSSSGAFLGMVVIEISIDRIKAILNKDLGLPETGRLFLATTKGDEVVHGKAESRSSLAAAAVSEALSQSQTAGEFFYNEKPVLGFYFKQPGRDWILAAEIDKSEALAPATAALRSSATVAAVVLLLTGIGLFLAIQKIINFFVMRHILGIFSKVQTSLQSLKDHVHTLSAGGVRLAESSSMQAACLVDTVELISDLNTKTQENNSSASELSSIATDARNTSEAGKEETTLMLAAIEELSDSSQEVATIIKTIDEIAFQTNILALNAAVEAARAGESGAGFAVVADEVRNLAQRSAEAASQTAHRISASLDNMQRGKKASADVNARLSGILDSVTSVDNFSARIAQATNDQAVRIHQVNETVQQLESISTENAASAEETAAAAQDILSEARDLEEQIAGLLSNFGYDLKTIDRPPVSLDSIQHLARNDRFVEEIPENTELFN